MTTTMVKMDPKAAAEKIAPDVDKDHAAKVPPEKQHSLAYITAVAGFLKMDPNSANLAYISQLLVLHGVAQHVTMEYPKWVHVKAGDDDYTKLLAATGHGRVNMLGNGQAAVLMDNEDDEKKFMDGGKWAAVDEDHEEPVEPVGGPVGGVAGTRPMYPEASIVGGAIPRLPGEVDVVNPVYAPQPGQAPGVESSGSADTAEHPLGAVAVPGNAPPGTPQPFFSSDEEYDHDDHDDHDHDDADHDNAERDAELGKNRDAELAKDRKAADDHEAELGYSDNGVIQPSPGVAAPYQRGAPVGLMSSDPPPPPLPRRATPKGK